MTSSALRRATTADRDAIAPDREEAVARYRRLRDITLEHHSACLRLIPAGALLRQGRRLGVVHGGTFVLEDMDEMNFVYDLAIHTAPPDRTRAIDRYARSAKVEPGSDEARALEAMRRARFTIVGVERRHSVAGLVVSDLISGAEEWLMDEALEVSAPEGSAVVTRLYSFEDFCMTAGVVVPFDDDLMLDAIEAVPFLGQRTLKDALSNRRFTEAVYRAAIEDGVTDRVHYRDVASDEAVASGAVDEDVEAGQTAEQQRYDGWSSSSSSISENASFKLTAR